MSIMVGSSRPRIGLDWSGIAAIISENPARLSRRRSEADFFKIPEPEPASGAEVDPLRETRPGPWVGGVVPLELVVARSDRAAVVLTRIAAYPEGFSLAVHSYLHRSVRPRSRHPLNLMMMGHPMCPGGEPVAEEMLRIGLAWPDGGRATNLDGWGRRPDPDAEEPDHGLEVSGGGGSESEFQTDCWAWPVPTAGELLVVVEWPAFGIGETRTAIDASLIADAAGRARPVWPEDAGKPSHLTRLAMMRLSRAAHGWKAER
jgi:hypothetical protein